MGADQIIDNQGSEGRLLPPLKSLPPSLLAYPLPFHLTHCRLPIMVDFSPSSNKTLNGDQENLSIFEIGMVEALLSDEGAHKLSS